MMIYRPTNLLTAKAVLINIARLLLLISFVSMEADMMASSYFVSVDGDDLNNGTSTNTAWKSIAKVNTVTLYPGDGVSFQRGGVFRGQLQIGDSGKKGRPIVIGAYGAGAKPVLYGAVPLKSWSAYKDGVYVAHQEDAVTSVYMNDGLQCLARYPNTGFSTIEKGDKISLFDEKGLSQGVDLTGATVRIRSVNWQYEVMTVAASQSNMVRFTRNMKYQCSAGYGYFLENKLAFLDAPGEWFYEQANRLIYFVPGENIDPERQKIEAVIYDYGLVIKPSVGFVQIQDLDFEKYDQAAIYGMNGSSHVSITGCTIRDIDVFGISLGLNSGHYLIKGNTLEDIRGRGITTLESSDNDISDNVVRRIGLYPGLGFGGVNNAIGIAVLKSEATFSISERVLDLLKEQNVPADVMNRLRSIVNLPYSDEKFLVSALAAKLGQADSDRIKDSAVKLVKQEMKKHSQQSQNNRVAYNLIEDTGYAGIRLDGRNSIAEHNVIRNTILHMNDGGALYCWGQNTNYTYNNTFRGNVIINVVGNSEATPNNAPYVCGIYLDNRTHHIKVENNIVIRSGVGILINDESHDQYVTGNTCYDNRLGLDFDAYATSVSGCKAFGNVLFGKEKGQRALLLKSHVEHDFRPAVLDRNIYGYNGTLPIEEKLGMDGSPHIQDLTLQQWQRSSGQDAHSKAIDAGPGSLVLVNDGFAARKFQVPPHSGYYDIHGRPISGVVKLQPFTSRILIPK